jgi:hypothetical protein
MHIRALLESMKWLPAADILQTGAVSTTWHSVAENEELWSCLLFDKSENLLLPTTLSIFLTSKALYRALYTYHHIAVVFHSKYAQFDLKAKSTNYIELLTPTTITRASYLLFLPDKSLFACGGDIRSTSYYDSGLTSAYRIAPIQWTVSVLSEMTQRRRYPGAYYYKGNVYVFGGSDESIYLSSAELFSISRNEWRNLPNAGERRNSFTPVMYKLEIYLVGGSKTDTVEAFHVQKLSYRKLPILLPGRVDCTCVVSASILTAFTMQRAFTFDLSTEEQRNVSSIMSHDYVWSNGQPLVYKGQVWFYYWHLETVVSFDFEGRFTKHPTFTFASLENRN